jgi:transcriptional regulator with XRE-family HTH domain
MEGFTPCERIIVTLREQLKMKGYRHREVASRLGVSQGTVKNYLSGKGVSIKVLQRLAETVGLDLLSLAALAQQESTSIPELNKSQQQALVKNQLLRMTFFLLHSGWTVPQIVREFGMFPEKMNAALVRLEALGVIRRSSSNGVRFLACPNSDMKASEFGALERELGLQCLREINLRDADAEWATNAVRLSPASVTRLRKISRDFIGELLALSRSDIDLPSGQVQWYRLLVSAQPISRKKLLRSD